MTRFTDNVWAAGQQPGDEIGVDALDGDIADTVAVLPFLNLSGDPDQNHLGDGIAEDVSAALASVRHLLVTGWGSSITCRPFSGDVPRVAVQLGVRYVVEGSVRRVGNRLQVSATLHDDEQPRPVWTQRFEVWMTDASALPAEIARLIAERIAPVGGWTGVSLANLPDPETYELVLRARSTILRGGGVDDAAMISDGIALAEAAVARDRRFGEALRCVAWGYCLRGELGRFEREADADYEAARLAALRLRDLESGSAGAHAILGHTAMRQMRHEDALTNLRQAQKMEPHAVVTLRWLSWELANHELTDEALRYGALSLRLSPCDKLVTQGHWTLALAEYVAGRLESCVGHARHALAMRPRLAVHYVVLAACLAALGELSEAHYTLEAARSLCPGLVESRLAGHCYFVRPGLTERYVADLRLAAESQPAYARTVPAEPRLGPASSDDASAKALAALTTREREVLALVAQGHSNAAIGERLGISDHTVKRHIANVLTRLQLPTRGAAAILAARQGLI